MAKPLLSNELWEELAALLPPPKPRRYSFPGRKPVDNRKVFTGILFVLKAAFLGKHYRARWGVVLV